MKLVWLKTPIDEFCWEIFYRNNHTRDALGRMDRVIPVRGMDKCMEREVEAKLKEGYTPGDLISSLKKQYRHDPRKHSLIPNERQVYNFRAKKTKEPSNTLGMVYISQLSEWLLTRFITTQEQYDNASLHDMLVLGFLDREDDEDAFGFSCSTKALIQNTLVPHFHISRRHLHTDATFNLMTNGCAHVSIGPCGVHRVAEEGLAQTFYPGVHVIGPTEREDMYSLALKTIDIALGFEGLNPLEYFVHSTTADNHDGIANAVFDYNDRKTEHVEAAEGD